MRKSARHLWLARVPLACVLLCVSCGEREARPNLILISIDTLRADHLGLYGYERATSPRLDGFGREALVFERAYAPAPWTLPSHAAMLTGRHPREIGFRDDDAVVPAAVPTLAEVLAAAGYRTAAFVDSSANGYVGAARGFARGFESYKHAQPREDGGLRYDVGATVDAALGWLGERQASRPFFLFLHTKSVHAVPAKDPCHHASCPPYDQPAPWRFSLLPGGEPRYSWVDGALGSGQDYLWGLNREIFGGRLRPGEVEPARLGELVDLYDAGIRYTDAQLGRLFDALADRGLAESTIVAVTADHGEAFLEHDFVVHQQLYEPLLRVPLLLRVPGEGARRLAAPVALETLAPALLRLLSLAPPAGMVAPLALDGGSPGGGERAFFATYEVPSKFPYRAASVRRGRYELILHNPREGAAARRELYDLAADPTERRPVTDQPELAAELESLLQTWLARPPEHAATLEKRGQADEALRALPYID